MSEIKVYYKTCRCVNCEKTTSPVVVLDERGEKIFVCKDCIEKSFNAINGAGQCQQGDW